MKTNQITIGTKINAPIEKVWELWTRPNHITQWNFASSDWCCPKVENNLETGGEFVWRMEAKDGSFGFDFKGIYQDIIINQLITYRLEDHRLVSINFKDKPDHVEVIQSFEAEGTHTDEQQKNGWQAILNNFKSYVESRNSM